MADLRERELVRAAKEQGTPEAYARAIRHLVRNGWGQIDAEREVCGVARGDVLTWQHPGTKTVHLALDRTRDGDGYQGDVRRRHNAPEAHSRAPCGAHGPTRANPEARRGWPTSVAFRLLEVPEVGWRQVTELTCLTCRAHAWIYERPDQATFGWDMAHVETVRYMQKQTAAWGLKLFECVMEECPPGCRACSTHYAGMPCGTCGASGINPVHDLPEDEYFALGMGPDCEHGVNPLRCRLCAACPECKGWRRVWPPGARESLRGSP